MYPYSYTSVLFLQLSLVATHYVSDNINRDTNFYYKILSERPSKSASIEFSVSCDFKRGKCGGILLYFYTTENDINLKTNCTNRVYGQLKNENMYVDLRPGGYRETKCDKDEEDLMLRCHGKIFLQDFLPRQFAFSFGFGCPAKRSLSLKGLNFNVSIYDETNATKCSSVPGHISCRKYYSHMSLPNMLSDADFVDVSRWWNWIAFYPFGLSGLCYKYLPELICLIGMPKCESKGKHVVHPCKETCYEFSKGCLEDSFFRDRIMSSFKNSYFHNFYEVIESLSELRYKDIFNCDYLPSVNGFMPCFYEQVTCGTPPNVTNTFIQENEDDLEDANDKHTYNVNDKVEYTCEDASFDMKGNNTVTFKYNGQWSEAPHCILKSESTNRISKIILILLGVMFVAISPLVLILIVKLKRKKLNFQLLTRDKEYDAFVCYDEADTDFAHGPVLIELEEKPVSPFKLLVHQRDFKPGYNIMWNISHAIKNSNSAIIVMSQYFVNAGWCKEEFNACYVENMNDPAFKLFVIMRQSVDTLTNTNEFMQIFRL